MAKKKTSYQKLKEQNQKLLQDIRTLVHKDTSEKDRIELQLSYRFLFEAEEMIWYGNTGIKVG